MDNFPLYTFGYIPEVSAVVGMRMDVQEQAIKQIQDEFGGRLAGVNFNVFASIQVTERRGNEFGRAFYAYNGKGEGFQIRAGQKEWEHLYAFLFMACAKAVDGFMRKDQAYWPRVLIWRLDQSPDVVNLLTEAKVVTSSLIVAA